MDIAGFERFAALYIIENPILFQHSEPHFFTNDYLKAFFSLSKSFYETYRSPIIRMIDMDIENTLEYLNFNREKVIVHISQDLSDDEKISNFKDSLKYIIEKDYKSYDQNFIKDKTEAWIKWKNFITGLSDAIKYQKLTDITTSNVGDVINKCKTLINTRSSVDLNDGDAVDFYDASTHAQPPVDDLIPSGYPIIDKWLGGGFEKGTSTMFYAGTNVGKSIKLINLAINASSLGYNVFFPSLEMATHRIAKRGGSNLFDISMDQYDEISLNHDFMKNIIDKWLNDMKSNNDKDVGHFKMKRFSRANILDIAAYARQLEEKLDIKWDIIILDYFTELDNSYGVPPQNSYMYHRLNSRDFFDVGVQNDWAMVSAHQIPVGSIDEDDITLADSGESKGIAFKTDNIIGMMQTPNMKENNIYLYKLLKSRNGGGYKNYKTIMDVDYSRMRISSTGKHFNPIDEVPYHYGTDANINNDTKIDINNDNAGFDFEGL